MVLLTPSKQSKYRSSSKPSASKLYPQSNGKRSTLGYSSASNPSLSFKKSKPLSRPRFSQLPYQEPDSLFDDDTLVKSRYELDDDEDALSQDDRIQGDEYASDDQASLQLDWDEEKTLLSALMDDSPQDSPCSDKILTLAQDRLPKAFAAQSAATKQSLVRTLHPVISATKQAFDVLKNKADDKIAGGALAYDAACKKLEAAIAQKEEKIRIILEGSKERISALQRELDAATAAQEKVFQALEKELAEIDLAMQDEYDHIATDGERIIEAAEKKCKKMEKDEESKTNKAKLLENMLKKL